jgi:hypothetical protein
MTMTTTRRLLHAVLAAALLAALPAQAAVSGVMTYSGILKSAAGTPVTTSTNITFRLYTASSGGTAIWNDTVAVTPGADGWFSAPLGILNPLVPSTLGQDLYLSLQVGTDVEFTQRARVTPSGSALAVDWSGVQGKPTCATGQYLTLNGSGGLLCSAPAGGTGGLTSVLTAAPVSGNGLSGSPVTLAPCPAGQILQSNGTSWSCIATPTGGTGGVTSVGVTAPVTNTGTASVPNIGVGLASDISSGIITAADFTAFNAKAPTNNPTFTGTVTAPTFVGSLSGNAATASTAANSNNLGGLAPTAFQKITVPMALDDLGVQFGTPTKVNVSLGSMPQISTWLLPVASGGTCVAGTTIVPVGYLGGTPSVTLSTTTGATGGSYQIAPGAVTIKAGSVPGNSLTWGPVIGATTGAPGTLNSNTVLMTGANSSSGGPIAVAGDVIWFRVCNFAVAPNLSFYLVGVQFTWN